MPLSQATVTYLRRTLKVLKHIDCKNQLREKAALIFELKKIIQSAPQLDELPMKIVEIGNFILTHFNLDPEAFLVVHELWYTMKEAAFMVNPIFCESVAGAYGQYMAKSQLSPAQLSEACERQSFWITKLISLLDIPQLDDLKLMNLGFLYLKDNCSLFKTTIFTSFLEKKPEEAEKYFNRIKNKDMKLYAFAILNYHRGNYKHALKNLDAVKPGSTPMYVDHMRANCYQKLGDKQNALLYYEKSKATVKCKEAFYKIGLIHLDDKNYQEAAKCFKEAKDLAEASFLYYQLCAENKVPNEDKTTAFPYLEQAKKWGHPDALYVYGQQCEVQHDIDQAIECYDSAKRMTHVPSILRLAKIYLQKGTKNLEKSRDNYILAAKHNNLEATLYVANQYYYGRKSFTKDKDLAFVYFKLAADKFTEKLKTAAKKEAVNLHYQLATIYALPIMFNRKKALLHAKSVNQALYPKIIKLIRDLTSQKKEEPAQQDEPVKEEAVPEEVDQPDDNEEKSIEDLMQVAQTLQQDQEYSQASEIWQTILDMDDMVMTKIKASSALADCYYHLFLAKQLTFQDVRLQVESALNYVSAGLCDDTLSPADESELLSWRQFLIEQAAELGVDIDIETNDEPPLPTTPIPSQSTALINTKLEQKPFDDKKLARTPHFIEITPAIRHIHALLKSKNFSLLLVGGAVRDSLTNTPCRDYDLITNCSMQTLLLLFPEQAHIIGHQTPIVIIEQGGERLEIKCYQNLTQDYHQRDFTVNALVYDIDKGELIANDIARTDIEKRLIRAVGDPIETFSNDPVRILRAIRLQSMKFQFEETTKIAFEKPTIREALQKVNADRLFAEMMKLFISSDNVKNIKLLDEQKLLKSFFPLCSQFATDPTCKSISRMLDAASKDKSISPALVIATLLLPPLQRFLGNLQGKYNNLAIEERMEQILQLQIKSFPIPDKYYRQIKNIWRLYFVMRNLYQRTVSLAHITYANYTCAEALFSYDYGRDYKRKTAQPRNNNEKAIKELVSPERKLMNAIVLGHYAQAQTFIAQCEPVKIVEPFSHATLLHLAARHGDERLLKLVYTACKASLNRTDCSGQTPLHYASKSHVAAVDFLLQSGADANAVDAMKQTSLHLAAAAGNYDIVKLLLSTNPILVDCQTVLGETALHKAITHRHYAVAQLLLEHKAKITLADKKGKTALDLVQEDKKHFEFLPMMVDAALEPVVIKTVVKLNKAVLFRCDPAKVKGLSETAMQKLKANYKSDRSLLFSQPVHKSSVDTGKSPKNLH